MTTGKIVVAVRDGLGAQASIVGADVTIEKDKEIYKEGVTGKDGRIEQDVELGEYTVTVAAFGLKTRPRKVELDKEYPLFVGEFTLQVGVECTTGDDTFTEGDQVTLKAEPDEPDKYNYAWSVNGGFLVEPSANQNNPQVRWDTNGLRGDYTATLTVSEKGSASITTTASITVLPGPVQRVATVPVALRRTATAPTLDLPLWVVIRNSTEAISFDNYLVFMDHVLCGKPLPQDLTAYERDKITADPGGKTKRFEDLRDNRRFLPYTDAEAYRLLKVATEAFLIVNCGVALATFPFTQSDLDDLIRRVGTAVNLDPVWQGYLKAVNGTPSKTLPYLALVRQKLPDALLKDSIFAEADLPQDCFGILRRKLTEPCLLELIWSYWHEEGMLVQTLNTIGRRFQNIRGPAERDPLAMLEIDPLRPLNNLLWGYIQDEQHRLTLVRRAYEYDHHYGLRLEGKAVPELQPADSRSKFLEGFHNLLHLCSVFYKEDDDATIIADGFPVLNGLKEVHLLLSEGAHNQFGDLPSTARQEMLMQQWLLARPEFREFLPTRIMVAYPEPWMDRVDAMKRLQGWTDTNVLHFRNLGVFGEQILLSIRFGAWSVTNDPAQAANWARYWRAEIQGYIHAYRAVTGVDLTTEATTAQEAALRSTQPSVLLRQRLAGVGAQPMLPAGGPVVSPATQLPGARGAIPAPRRTRP
jgi:hypothetical protein